MDNIKVSIIVPVYNVAAFFPKCIESLINQDYSNIEIILVNDGSTDNSREMCDYYKNKDSRICVIHKENPGVSEARNSGLEQSTGEYVCFVDGDDFVMPDYCRYLLKLAEEYRADISLTTEMFGNFNEKQIVTDHIQIWNEIDAVESILCYRVPIGCYCKLFKRRIVDQVRFLPDLFIGEGFNFNIDAFQNSTRIVAGKKKIYYYRRDNPTIAMTKFAKEKCECGINAIKVIKQKLNIKNQRIEKAWRFAYWRTYSDFYDMIALSEQKDKYPEFV